MNASLATILRHPIEGAPYDRLGFARFDGNGIALYAVDGETVQEKATKALRRACRSHGGRCFYCAMKFSPGSLAGLSIDHAVPRNSNGGEELANLLIACRPCNLRKGKRDIVIFDLDAAQRYTASLALQLRIVAQQFRDDHRQRGIKAA